MDTVLANIATTCSAPNFLAVIDFQLLLCIDKSLDTGLANKSPCQNAIDLEVDLFQSRNHKKNPVRSLIYACVKCKEVAEEDTWYRMCVASSGSIKNVWASLKINTKFLETLRLI